MSEKSNNKLHAFMIYAVLALATIFAYEPVRHNRFISYDDDVYITENPQVQAGLTRQSVVWAFTSTDAANWHPLTWLSHMLDCELFGLNPFWHHLTNLLLHTANTLLLFLVLKKMTGALWQSAFVAAAFALHPLHVESVAWAAERKDVLGGLFWMLTIAAYIRYYQSPRVSNYLLVLLVFALGLMAKPMLVTLPFVLLLLDYWPLGRLRFDSRDKTSYQTIGRLIKEKIPLLIPVVLLSVITFIAQQKGGGLPQNGSLTPAVRLVNAFSSYLRYVIKMIYPTRLAVLYPYPKKLLLDEAVIFAAVVLLLLLRYRRKRPWLTVGLLWYVGTLIPVIGLVQVGSQAMADRYTYLPSIGFFIIVAWAAAEVFSMLPYRKIFLAVSAAAVLAAMLICTRIQLGYWKNTVTLYEHTLAVTKDNYIIHNNLGKILYNAGRLEQAVKHYEHALYANPKYFLSRFNLALALSQTGNVDQAIGHINQVLQENPNWPVAYFALAEICYNHGRYNQAVKAGQTARQLVLQTGDKQLAELIESRLEFYKANQPYKTNNHRRE